MKYIITRQNSDGTFDTVGMKNRCIVDGYKTYKNAFKFAINPYGAGRVCKVETYPSGNVYGEPASIFQTLTFAYTRGA
jgi:hypothetical protein